MRVEIAEQPEALSNTFDALLAQAGELAALGRDTRQVLFIARGSSDNAAVYGQYLCSARAGRLASLASPSLATAYRAVLDLRGVLAVAVSQSGATEEIVTTLEWARHCGARTVAVTNVAGSPLTEVADLALITQAGEELAVPATKTYTTQLAAMAVLALSLQPGGSGAGPPGAPGSGCEAPRGPGSRVEGVAGGAGGGGGDARGGAGGGGAGRAAGRGRDPGGVGAGLCVLDRAGGGAEAEGDLLPDGRRALLRRPGARADRGRRHDTPALLVAAGDGPILPEMTGLARRIAGTGADVYGIGGDQEFVAACRSALPGPSLPEHLAPFALIVPGQLLVEALARAKGLDPDAPRGLDKVTQTDG